MTEIQKNVSYNLILMIVGAGLLWFIFFATPITKTIDRFTVIVAFVAIGIFNIGLWYTKAEYALERTIRRMRYVREKNEYQEYLKANDLLTKKIEERINQNLKTAINKE